MQKRSGAGWQKSTLVGCLVMCCVSAFCGCASDGTLSTADVPVCPDSLLDLLATDDGLCFTDAEANAVFNLCEKLEVLREP